METTDEQIRQEATDCLARKIRQARSMSDRELFFAGAELFEEACKVTFWGIRHQNPDWTDDECNVELKRRIEKSSWPDDSRPTAVKPSPCPIP